MCVWEVENHVFSKFGCLGGDFYKGTHEAKLFGMQIGSVLSGVEAGNVNNDSKKPVLGLKAYAVRGRKW